MATKGPDTDGSKIYFSQTDPLDYRAGYCGFYCLVPDQRCNHWQRHYSGSGRPGTGRLPAASVADEAVPIPAKLQTGQPAAIYAGDDFRLCCGVLQSIGEPTAHKLALKPNICIVFGVNLL